MTMQEIKNNSNYKYHHTASRRGYESRRGDGHVESYKGRFGEGFIIVTPRYDTTSYVDISYYIKVA